jgi:hypothetical protein
MVIKLVIYHEAECKVLYVFYGRRGDLKIVIFSDTFNMLQ